MTTAVGACYRALRCLCGQGEQKARLKGALRALSATLYDNSPAFAAPGLRGKWLESKARGLWLHCRDRLKMGSDTEQIDTYLATLYSMKDRDVAVGALVEDILGVFEHLVRDGFP